jgi:hypothetical protein
MATAFQSHAAAVSWLLEAFARVTTTRALQQSDEVMGVAAQVLEMSAAHAWFTHGSASFLQDRQVQLATFGLIITCLKLEADPSSRRTLDATCRRIVDVEAFLQVLITNMWRSDSSCSSGNSSSSSSTAGTSSGNSQDTGNNAKREDHAQVQSRSTSSSTDPAKVTRKAVIAEPEIEQLWCVLVARLLLSMGQQLQAILHTEPLDKDSSRSSSDCSSSGISNEVSNSTPGVVVRSKVLSTLKYSLREVAAKLLYWSSCHLLMGTPNDGSQQPLHLQIYSLSCQVQAVHDCGRRVAAYRNCSDGDVFHLAEGELLITPDKTDNDAAAVAPGAATEAAVEATPSRLSGDCQKRCHDHVVAAVAGEGVQVEATALLELGQQLEMLGKAVCAQLPLHQCCNHHGCINLLMTSELKMVSGRRCMCGGCTIARYCSLECQKAHWSQWHKPVCKWLQQQQLQQQC